jgi:hypothetical protein
MSQFPPDILKHVRLHKRLEMVNNCCGDEHGRHLWQSYSASAAGFPKFSHHHCDGTDLPGGSGCYCEQQKIPILLGWNCDPILLLSNFLRQLQSTSAFVCVCVEFVAILSLHLLLAFTFVMALHGTVCKGACGQGFWNQWMVYLYFRICWTRIDLVLQGPFILCLVDIRNLHQTPPGMKGGS